MSFEIEKVAELARISLKPEEKQKLKKDLEAILGYIEQLKKLSTDHVEPTSHVMNIENVFRPDKVETSNVIDELIQTAPDTLGKLFKVPKVVDKE